MTPNNPQQPTDDLSRIFEDHFKSPPEAIERLPVSGSDRRYYRLKSGKYSAIGTTNTNVAENNTYFYFTELFRKHEVNVPEVYAISKDRKSYLQQDLGSTSLFDMLRKDGLTDGVRAEYRKALDQLAKLQWIAGRHADFNQCFSTKQFDEKAILADLQYFKYYFADLHKVHYDRSLVMDEMESLSKELGRMQPLTLMYRDFQSRNILLHEGKVWFIDFQGAMQGPPQYDLASLLWQAKAGLPPAWREDLLNGYIASRNELPIARMDEIHFRRGYAQFVLLRLMQVLGAYGFRGLMEGKPHFISSIAPALKNLEIFLSDHPQIPAYPELRKLLENLVSNEVKSRYQPKALPENQKLKVSVCSFSYKKGIPKSESSHGGGYVFDCRGILNPGRYDLYKHLTGQEDSVKEFLEQKTDIPTFIENVKRLVSINVEDYMSRGFEELTIAFGCTGGQHRSVYASEVLVAWLRDTYGVSVTLEHLNRDNWVTEAVA